MDILLLLLKALGIMIVWCFLIFVIVTILTCIIVLIEEAIDIIKKGGKRK